MNATNKTLEQFIEGLKTALGEQLKSVIAFGSFATNEFQEGKSSINIFILTEMLTADVLQKITAPIQAWMASGHGAPVLMRQTELMDMARLLPIEFLDMVDHHRLLFGADPFTNFNVDASRLGFQVEHDIATLLLKLRRSTIQAVDEEARGKLLLQSWPSALTLCRALLRSEGLAKPALKAEAAHQLSAKAALNRDLIDQLEAFRKTGDARQAGKSFSAYLEFVEKLLHYAQSGK